MNAFRIKGGASSLLQLPGFVALGLGLTSCGAPGGEVSLLLEPEAAIIEGIPAGPGAEEIQDGWSVTFSQYVMTVGPVQLRSRGGDDARGSDSGRFAIDLRQLPARGTELWKISDLADGRWDVLFASEASGAERHESVSADDFDALAAGGFTHLLGGTLTHPAGRSCPPASLADVPSDAEPIGQNAASDDCYAATTLSFSLRLRAEVTYGPCVIDGLPGVAVSAGEVETAAISMHGDHLFFGGFPEGSEGEVRRYAQWLADCDLNLDGVVTSEELEQIPPSLLAEFDERFPLGGSPLRPVDNLLTYVASQLSTQGHFEGEGECAIGFEPLDVP